MNKFLEMKRRWNMSADQNELESVWFVKIAAINTLLYGWKNSNYTAEHMAGKIRGYSRAEQSGAE